MIPEMVAMQYDFQIIFQNMFRKPYYKFQRTWSKATVNVSALCHQAPPTVSLSLALNL